jgi:hypothetical protein
MSSKRVIDSCLNNLCNLEILEEIKELNIDELIVILIIFD